MPRSIYLAHNKVEGLVAEAYRCVNSVTLSTVPSTGSPDRRQYDQESSNAPAAFYISPQTGYRNPSNNGPPWFPSEPQPPQTSTTLPDDNASYLQAIQSFGGNGYTPDKPDPPFPLLRNQLYSLPYESQLFKGSANATFSQTMPLPSQQPQVNANTVDDFGVYVHSNGPIESSITSGGRFATFPVKRRTSGSFGGYSLLDPPLLDGRQITGDSSLSKSIEEALQEKEGPSSGSWAAPPVMGGSESSKGKTIAREGSHRTGHPDDNPPPFEMILTESGTVPSFPVDKKDRFQDQPSALQPSENHETLLAYMNGDSANPSPTAVSFLGPPAAAMTTKVPAENEDGRHVRFGSVTGVDKQQAENTPAVGTSLTEGPDKGIFSLHDFYYFVYEF